MLLDLCYKLYCHLQILQLPCEESKYVGFLVYSPTDASKILGRGLSDLYHSCCDEGLKVDPVSVLIPS